MNDTLAPQKYSEHHTTKYTVHSMLNPWVAEMGWSGWGNKSSYCEYSIVMDCIWDFL